MELTFSAQGRITAAPIEEISEQHGKNIIVIQIYDTGSGFLYGLNCKIERIIRSKYPKIDDKRYGTVFDAKNQACKELARWVNDSPKARKAYREFIKIKYNQLELF